MFVEDCWYVAAWSDDLEVKQPFAIKIIGKPIVIYRAEQGELVALEDRCVHRLAPLSLGRCEGRNLRCMYHGLLFDPQGRCIEIPGQELIPSKARVKAYPVVEKHSWIWVWMGDPEKADESLVPNSKPLDDPDWHFGHGFLDYEARYELINDNLTDFSHLSYTHANSFMAGPNWALSKPRSPPWIAE